MIKKGFIFILFQVLIASFIFSQPTRKYWKSGDQYVFEAIYLENDGSVLTKETVTICATGKKWDVDDKQTLADLKLNFSSADSVRFAPRPLNGIQRAWVKNYQEGVIGDGGRIWMHPIRENQYKLTEIAPFPEVQFPAVKGKTWSKTLWIGDGWGLFEGSVNSVYTVDGLEARTYSCGTFKCWKIVANGKHNKLGENIAVFYFNEELGFTEMDYTFYNNQKILFKLKDFKM